VAEFLAIPIAEVVFTDKEIFNNCGGMFFEDLEGNLGLCIPDNLNDTQIVTLVLSGLRLIQTYNRYGCFVIVDALCFSVGYQLYIKNLIPYFFDLDDFEDEKEYAKEYARYIKDTIEKFGRSFKEIERWQKIGQASLYFIGDMFIPV